MALLLLRSLCLVILRFQRAGIQTDTTLFKKHGIFQCGSAFTDIFQQRCLHLNQLRLMQKLPYDSIYKTLDRTTQGAFSVSNIAMAPCISNKILLLENTQAYEILSAQILPFQQQYQPELQSWHTKCTLNVAWKGWDTWRLQQKLLTLPQNCIPTTIFDKSFAFTSA